MNQRSSTNPAAHASLDQIQRSLEASSAFRNLDRATQRELAQAMAKISGALAQGGDTPRSGAAAGPIGRAMAPDLISRIGRQDASPGPAPGGAPAPGPAPGGQGQPGGGGTVGRVGEVARTTLNAIDFPSFVGSLIQGTFQSIVDASIQQMEAYAELVQNVAGTVDQFMQDNVTEDAARDYLAEKYPELLTRTTHGRQPHLAVQGDAYPPGELPGFFRELGFDHPQQIDERQIETVVVPATRRFMAEQRQQVLATMVLMGINRVVVDDGEIRARLQFHIDASELTELRFDHTKSTLGTMSRPGGGTPFSANGILVNTMSLNAQSDINVRADLTGEVRVKFRSETFPLERFADSAAIQLINRNARVPESDKAARAGDADGQEAGGAANDPWAPQARGRAGQ